MGLIGCPETSLVSYSTKHKIPADRRSHHIYIYFLKHQHNALKVYRIGIPLKKDKNKGTKDAKPDAVRVIKEKKFPFAERLRRTLSLAIREYFKILHLVHVWRNLTTGQIFPSNMEHKMSIELQGYGNVDFLLFRLTSGGLLQLFIAVYNFALTKNVRRNIS